MTSTTNLPTGGEIRTNDHHHRSGISLPANEAKRRVWQMNLDVFLLSLPFFILFTSVASLNNLQSSMNASLGTASMSVIYGADLLSAAFLPTLVIRKFGQQTTIAVSLFVMSVYIVVQYYPRVYTLLPAAAVFGLVKTPLMAAQYTLLTRMGTIYAELTGGSTEACITRFFGFFFLIFSSCNISGNLISSQVLPSDPTLANTSSTLTLGGCGAGYCERDEGNGTSQNSITSTQRLTLTSICLALALLSPLVYMLVSNSSKRYDAPESTIKPSTRQQILSTFNQMKKPYQLLMIPMLMWSGVQPSFIVADFTAAYVSCSLGVHMVGYTLVCYGVCEAVSSVLCSPVVNRVGRIPVICFASLLNGCLLGFLFYWQPSPDHLPVFFVVSGLWGVAHATWQTQVHALCGVLFGHDAEAAFSVYELWLSVGHIVAYVCSSLFCVTGKIFTMVAFYSFAVAGYALIEFLEWHTKRPAASERHS